MPPSGIEFVTFLTFLTLLSSTFVVGKPLIPRFRVGHEGLVYLRLAFYRAG